MNFEIGDIVKSTSGHDKNGLFVIISIDKNGFLAIIDCKHHTRANPKQKNPKHLIKVGHDEGIINKVNSPATDKEIYKAIQNFKKE